MAIADDFSIASNGDIRYVGADHGQAGAGYYTVIEFHRWLQDLADNASSSGDDILDITDDTPSERSTDNIITLYDPYNIDDKASEHLFDGSIIQKGGDEIYDGIVNFGVEGIYIQIMQNGALITNDFWNTTPDGESSPGLNRDTEAGISARWMLKVRTGGNDIDGRRLLGMAREYGKTYSEFPINGTSRGNNVLALTQADDLNNTTDGSTVDGWTDVKNETEGYNGQDIDNDGVLDYFYSKWTRGDHTINDLYEKMKYIVRRGTNKTMYGIDAGIFRGPTHEISLDSSKQSTTDFDAVEPVSWDGGTGQMLAIDDVNAATKMWVQLLTGTAPGNGVTITGGTSGATAVTNANATDRPLGMPQSTGSAIIGSYGMGVAVGDLTANDKLFDLSNNQKVTPNYVTFIVNGLVENEDRVLVAPESNGDIQIDQLKADGAQASGTTTLKVTATIPSDTPAAGTVRVYDGNTFQRLEYDSYSDKTFTLHSATNFDIADQANIFVSYIDDLYDGTKTTDRFTTIYSSDRSLFVRVRDGGSTPIKTFETTATLGSSGGSTTAIRTSDK